MKRRQEKHSQKSQHRTITNSGATSHFISKDLNLPRTGLSQIEVFLPDDSKLQSSSKTQLPFEQLTLIAREANILPGLTKSLMSVGKMSENGYTTVFLPGNQGVTIHREGTLTITTSEPPVLQGCKANEEKLWTVLTQDTNNTSEKISNAYSLPSTGQTIKYLHAAAGYPTEGTWTKAIKAGNYITWPALTISNVHKNIPESNETQKGRVKCQRQRVRSTKMLETIMEKRQ
jgi:hypothetical protein